MAKTNVLRNTAIIACLTFILSSCSGVRYGYISRVKDKQVEKTEIAASNENPAAEEELTPAAEQNAVLGFSETEEAPVIADSKTKALKECKTQTAANNSNLEIKKLNPRTLIKEIKRVNEVVKANPNGTDEAKEVSGYLRTGLILVLIGAILMFFAQPINFIGYIVMLVGLVFVVLGLIDML